jgi:hypothetical protein
VRSTASASTAPAPSSAVSSKPCSDGAAPTRT